MSDSCSRALAGAWLKAHLPNVAFQPWSAHVFSRRVCVMMAASVRPNTLQLNKYIKTRAITINSASSKRSRLLFATKTRFVHFGWTRVCDQHPFVKKHQKNICSKIMKNTCGGSPSPHARFQFCSYFSIYTHHALQMPHCKRHRKGVKLSIIIVRNGT